MNYLKCNSFKKLKHFWYFLEIYLLLLYSNQISLNQSNHFQKKKYCLLFLSRLYISSPHFFSPFILVCACRCAQAHTQKYIHVHSHLYTHLQQNSFPLFIRIYNPLIHHFKRSVSWEFPGDLEVKGLVMSLLYSGLIPGLELLHAMCKGRQNLFSTSLNPNQLRLVLFKIFF